MYLFNIIAEYYYYCVVAWWDRLNIGRAGEIPSEGSRVKKLMQRHMMESDEFFIHKGSI